MKTTHPEAAAAVSPVSGSYRGNLTAPGGKVQRLDLRVDVDSRIREGAVLRRVSGDLFRIEKNALPGQPPKETEIYQESWILESPAVKSAGGATVITGVVRFWNGVHPKTSATIRIPSQPAGAPAEVTLLRQASPPMVFACAPMGMFFRSLHLELDVCKSVNAEPVLPRYGTHSVKQRPPNLSDRVLTLDRAYGEAGVEVLLRNEARTVVDDAAITAWTDAELHNAMEHHFSSYGGTWPKWEMWGLLAGEYENDLVGGIMFDYASADSGAGKAPERQGFAVFRKHFWFDDLVVNPTTQAQFESARRFLWCFTHEAGHAFNLLHSFDKNRDDALSWMNYPDNYDGIHGPGSFWKNFPFRFDDEELLHIRHGNRSSVIMGGDPWSSGGHAEAPPGSEQSRVPPGAMTSITGDVPLDLRVSSQGYFEFLEPVSIEVRARNLLPVPMIINQSLHPELGSVTVYIRRPDGRIIEYSPISCKVAPDLPLTLAAAGATDGSDRHSRSVFLSYGRYGFYFDEPGQYSVRAVYHGPGNLLIPSNVQRLRVGHPKSARADRIAQDFFSYQSGAALYLGGSHSRFLSSGMDTLLSMIHDEKSSMAGAKTAARIARGVGLPFHDMDVERDGTEAPQQPVLQRTTGGDTKLGLQLTELAMQSFQAIHSRELNISMERVVRTRAELLMRTGDEDAAHGAMVALAGYLRGQGVKQRVVEKVESDAATIAPAQAKRARKRSTSAGKASTRKR
jgi:hypothetical protein